MKAYWQGALYVGLGLLSMAPAPPACAQESPTATVTGRVTGAVAGDTVALPHAVVELLADDLASGARHTVMADENGHYALTGIEGGAARIRVLHAGHDPLELVVLVPGADTLRLDLHLAGEPVALGSIDVEGRQSMSATDSTSDATSAAGRSRLATEALRTTSGIAELGLAEAARRASGNDPPDPNGLLFMRGSTTDLKLVLLDGAPIHTPFHLGGLLDPIQPSTVGRTRFFLGGAPARYNGGISHILDIETREPDAETARGELSADLMGLSGVVESGVGPLSALVSGRVLHGAANALFADGPQPYGYADGLARVDLRVGPGRLSVTGFRNEESVNLDPAQVLQDQGLIAGGLGGLGSSSSTDAAWANAVLSARYRADFGRWTLATIASLSDYDARLPVGDTTLLIIGGASEKGHAAVDLDRTMNWGSVSLGASFDDVRVRERVDQLSGNNPATSTRTMRGRGLGGYVEGTRTFDGYTLRTGLRADAFEGHGRLELSPRASVLVPLSETALFRLAAGRFTQLARRSDPAIPSELGIQAPGFQEEPLLAVATATHLVASIDQRLSPAVTVGLEGFVKSFNGLPDAGGDRVNASGMDIRIARREGATQGWLGYTLTWFWSNAGALADARFSGHHLLTAGLAGPFARYLDGAVRLSYGSGLPFSSVPFGATADAAAPGGEQMASRSESGIPVPDESFLRLDLTVSGRLAGGTGGRSRWTVSPYVRILNALDRRDSLFYYFEPWRADSPRPLADLPVLPLIGVRVAF